MFVSHIAWPQDEPDWKKLEAYYKLLEENNKFMGGVAIYKGEKRLFEYYAGFSSVEKSKRANYQTRYRIGSVTELFTAALVFQLIEEGQLTLDTKLSDYYPEITNSNKITISNLLNHRSGLHNYTSDDTYLNQMNKSWRKNELMWLITDFPIDFEPNEKACYSNTNYLLLGFIIEHITEESYSKLVEKHISKPNMMMGTRYGGVINTSMYGAHSYVFQNKQWEQMNQTDISLARGAGGLISTPRDLNVFAQLLFQNRIVNEVSLDSMLSFQDGYGRGVFEYTLDDEIAWGHNGSIDGFQSHVSYFPADSISISVLGNGMNCTLNEVITTALNALCRKAYKLPKFGSRIVEVSMEVLSKLEGNYYSDSYPERISLVIKDNKLYAQTSGYKAYPLTAYENGSFRFEPVGIEIQFKAGVYSLVFDEFVLKQRGAEFKFIKE